MTPLGTKGVGELAIVGMAAAIANAVYHATGTRVRSLPISIEKVLGYEASSPRTSSPLDALAGKPGVRAIRLSELTRDVKEWGSLQRELVGLLQLADRLGPARAAELVVSIRAGRAGFGRAVVRLERRQIDPRRHGLGAPIATSSTSTR
jgi:hypothetical protein